MTPRHLFNGVLTVALLAALILIGRVLIAPDAGASLFSKARQLEEAGQIALALRHYALVANRHPESSLAPQALLKQGELLSARGRAGKNTDDLRNAMNAYARLAENYPENELSNDALFDAGEIAAEDLSDGVSARKFYRLVMERNSDKSDATAMATTKLGRLALDEGDGKTALELLQSVFAGWPNNAEAGAEAQFHLGVLYETLLKDRNKAQRAYDRTLDQYPNSVWAGDARERLGLLAYNDQLGRRPVRRVLLDIAPLPDLDGLAAPGQGSDFVAGVGYSAGRARFKDRRYHHARLEFAAVLRRRGSHQTGPYRQAEFRSVYERGGQRRFEILSKRGRHRRKRAPRFAERTGQRAPTAALHRKRRRRPLDAVRGLRLRARRGLSARQRRAVRYARRREFRADVESEKQVRRELYYVQLAGTRRKTTDFGATQRAANAHARFNCWLDRCRAAQTQFDAAVHLGTAAPRPKERQHARVA